MTYDQFFEMTGLTRVPPYWDRRYTKNLDKMSKPLYGVKQELDVWMTLRDGTRLCVDIYRPDVEDEKFPALLAWSAYGKSIMSIKHGTLPSESAIFDHSLEAGDIDFFVSRGYIYVIPDPRGIGKSEGEFYGVYNPQEQADAYDVIEWSATIPGCDSQVAMIGYSYFGIIQMLAAAQNPPHLKCIMPLSFTDDYYQHAYYGGVPNTYTSMYWELCPSPRPVTWSEKCYGLEALEEMVAERVKDPDIAVNSLLMKIFTTWPPRYHTFYFDVLLHNLDGPFWKARSAQQMFDKVKVPVYLKCGWAPSGRWSATVLGAFMDPRLNVPKRAAAMEAYGGLELPYRFMNEECLRWYDHWLKNIDTGIMDEPPLKLNVLGAGYRYEKEWPLERTEYRKLYLRNFERLRWDADPEPDIPPDSFTHRPPNITNQVESLVYTSDMFTRPMEFTGPVTLVLYSSIDAEDANFLVKLWQLFPDGSRNPVCRFGALRASHRLVVDQSLPWKPVHDHTCSVPVKPGEINEYVIEINPMSMVFQSGQKMQLEIKSWDPFQYQGKTWVGKVGNLGPIPSAETINYKIYRDAKYCSHILLPFVAETPREQYLIPFA